MITQTRVKSGKPAQKIGYASVKPIMSDTDYSVQTAAPSRPFKQDPIGRLGFSISCGFYNDGWSYFVSPSLSLVEYPATGVTKHYRADLQLLKLSFLDTYQTKLSASSPALSSDILYARAAATMLDFMHGRDLTAFYYGSHPYTDRAANEFYPLGIPVFRIKRYPYFQENPFTSGLFSGYSDSYFISNDTAFSPLIPENTDPNCVGLYTTVTTNFVYASPSPTSGWLTVDMLTDTRFINGVLPNAYAGVDDYTFSRHNMSCSMPPYYVTRPPYYFNDLNKRGFSIHASAEGSAGSIDGDIYSTYDDNNGGYIVVSPTAAVCYKVSSTPEDPLKYAYRLNSPIDGIMRTCFGVDLSTNSLFFRDTYDTLTVLGVEQVTDVAFDRSAHPAVQYNVAYYQSGTDKKIIDNKKPVFEWFMPIHDALPAKSSAVAGQLIPEIFYKNCTKQKFNIRLDLLEVDSSQFIDGHGCVVITNPGVFINANNAEVTPAICFCNFELNSGDDINNLFVEIAYFPHVQYHVDAIAPDLLDNVTLLDKSNYIYFLESYYDTFDKIGKYVKQVRPLDTSYIEFVDYGESYGGPYHFAYNDLIPKGDFTDYYSSGFNVYILGEHLAPEDIPDIDNVDLSGFSILYSSNPIPKNVYFLANFSEKINSRLKQFNYTYLFPGYDSASEGDTFTYSASLYSSPEIDMCPDTGPLKYYSKNGLFSSKLEPFYHFMCSKVSTHIPIGFQQDMPIELGVNQTPYIYNPPLVIDYFPFQLSYFPVPIGPAAESALTEEQYFKKYGAKVEFKAFFYFANSWDVGSFDGTYTVGVFCHNSSSKIDVWVESESLAINTHCPASTSNLFLGELSNEDADFESTSLISTSILDKYGGVYRTGGAYHPSNLVGGSASLAGKTAIYSTEVAPNNVPTGVTTPADLPALSPGGTYTDGIIINYSDKKLLTKEHDVKLLVFTFSVYIAPINGFELANAEGGAVFAPGSVEADELLADGLVDVQIEFCEPLWDEVEEEYKYLSRYESADHRQFDGIYRIYSAMMYPHYLKKAG